MRKILLLTIIMTAVFRSSYAQNFSGLQYKRLVQMDDQSMLLESGLGALFGGKMTGNIDSVVVTSDAEHMLKLKIYYTGFENGYFTVSAMDASKRQLDNIEFGKFSHVPGKMPAETVLTLSSKVPKGYKLQSPFLRIDVAKDYNKLGKVYAFLLNKNWKEDLDPQNVIVNVNLSPIGKAASLTNENKDVTPIKTIRFDPNVLYLQNPAKSYHRVGGGNDVSEWNYASIALADDISGTWTNTDAATQGITRLIVTDNNSIQGFGKCSPQDCDWGKTALTPSGSGYRAVFSWSFKTTTLSINYSGGQLNVTATDNRKIGGSTTTNYTFKKNTPVVFLKANVMSLKEASSLSNVQGIVASSTEPKGPSKDRQFNLVTSFSADVDFKRPQDISNINLSGFLDKNLASNVIYILPADYHLKWDAKPEAEKGYNFRILYGSQAGGAGDAGASNAPVRMSATLTAGISSSEINFIKTLLKASFKNLKEVRFLPLRENPQFTFQSTLTSQYNIPQDKIAVETTTDLGNDIKVSWQTDADTKEFIQTALTAREGVAASVVLKPIDEEIVDQLIPASINIADTRTLGKISLQPNAWRTRNWRNTTPYPLQLNYLHVMKKENNGTNPIIYSWSLNDAAIPPQAQAAFTSNKVPSWLDNAEGVVMWVEYSVMDCGDCDKKVMDAVTGGVSGSKSQQVKFTIPPAVFDTLNASYFLITIRGKQVDPKGEEIKELDAIKLTREASEASGGPLYISAGGIDFEYKITAATADGDFFPVEKWIKANSKDILLGKTKMKEIFKGILPGLN